LEEIGLDHVTDAIGDAFKNGDLKRVEALLWPALDQFSQVPQLWFYAGNLFFQTGRAAPAECAFQRCLALEDNPMVLANLGASFRRLNKHEEGLRVLEAAIDRKPDYQPALVNLGSMYVNEGQPENGIPYLERAVELGRKSNTMERGAEWNLSLLYLEAGRFKEGFEYYRKGYGSERLIRTYGKESKGIPEPAYLQPDSPTTITDESGATRRAKLTVHGEQGLGDELMAATILLDASRDFDIILECHPRLEWLHRNSTWARRLEEEGREVRIYPTRKDDHIAWPIEDKVVADYKCPLLDLAARYRPDAESFRKASKDLPFFTCDAEESARYREQLKVIAGGRPIVGLATRGGVMQTARSYRTLRIPDADYLFSNTDCLFVGLDYDDMSQFANYAYGKYGEDRYRWLPAVVQHWDYHHTAALIDACDLVVTVCQTAFHMAASMGKPTRCLTPKRCAWRYAPMKDNLEESYWYSDPAIKLYRSSEDGWGNALERVVADIRGLSHG
jgi:tetratricopeptide (TPR) repeat protein